MQPSACRTPAGWDAGRHYVPNCCARRCLLFTSLYAPAFNLGALYAQSPPLILPPQFFPLWPTFSVIMLGAGIMLVFT